MVKPLAPCELVENTKEYARAILSEKSTFTNVESGQKCIYLADAYQTPFEYIHSVRFSLNEASKNWEAVVWDPNDPVVSDIIISIDLQDVLMDEVALVAEHVRTKNKIVLIKGVHGEIPIPLSGIPNVALQYIRLILVAKSPHRVAIVRSRILPECMRRHNALISHDIGNFIIRCGKVEEKQRLCRFSVCWRSCRNFIMCKTREDLSTDGGTNANNIID